MAKHPRLWTWGLRFESAPGYFIFFIYIYIFEYITYYDVILILYRCPYMELNNNPSIAIVSDGKYGHRAKNTLKKKFNCELFKIKYSGDFENIKISENLLDKMVNFHIIITYTRDPDLTYTFIEKINEINKNLNKNIFIIVGVWKGEGFKRQIESFKNVFCPDFMCNLKEDDLKDKLKDYPQLKEFLRYFGRPIINIYLNNNIIESIDIVRESPCGICSKVLPEFIGKTMEEKTLKNIGLRVQHFCNASKLRIFVEKECKKAKAGKILLDGVNIIL